MLLLHASNLPSVANCMISVILSLHLLWHIGFFGLVASIVSEFLCNVKQVKMLKDHSPAC